MNLQLEGKTALVTGASRGLGYATACLLSAEGANVVVNSRSASTLQQAAASIQNKTGHLVSSAPGDLTNPKTAAFLIEETRRIFGTLDILVVNAGGPPAGLFESFDDQAWQKAFDLCLLSQVRLIRAALPLLKTSSAASILTITSYSAKQPIPNLVLSNSLRAGMVGLTKTLALELGQFGIRVNSILPAWTETERVIELMTYRAETNHTHIEEEIKKQTQESPLGRMATTAEFANAAVFLVSPAASFITGVMLTVDGGIVKGTF